MTITPISAFGNLSATGTPLGASLGGLAGLFASLLGGNLESLEGMDLAQADSAADFQGLLSSLMGGDLSIDGSIGEALSAFWGEEGGQKLPILDLSNGGHTDLLSALEGSTSLIDTMPLGESPEEMAKWLQDNNAFGEGGQVVFQRIVVEIRQTTFYMQTSGVDFGSFEGAGQLAAAFEEMGMDPQVALEKAIRIEKAIEFVKSQLQAEIQGQPQMHFIPAMFDMMLKEGEAFSLDASMTHASFQISSTVVAFEASSTLSTGDLGMTVLKGEPIGASLTGQLATGAEKSLAKPLSVPAADNVAEAAVDAPVEDEFVPLKATDIPKASAEGAAEAVVTAQAKASMVGKSESQSQSTPATLWGSGNQPSEAREATSKRRVSAVSEDKVITTGKTQDLFAVKPKANSEELTFEIQSETGEVIDLDGLDENVDNVMEIVARKTSLEARVDGGSRLAMVKQANIAAQVQMQMRQLANQGGGEVKFRLDPPELGEMDINLKIAQGTVKGTIIVQSAEVAETLARDLRILQESFQEAGLELHEEGIQFQIREDDAGQQGGQGGKEGRDGQGGSEEGDDLLDMEGVEETPVKWVKPDSLLDVSV